MDNLAPKVSVVIVNYNRCEDLREALASIAAQDYPNVETIVVDNASSDDSNDMLKSEFPEVKLIRLAKNIGMDGYSIGLKQATGEFLFQMDNDSLMPDPTVLSKVVQAFQECSENVAVIATRVEELRGTNLTIDQLRAKDTSSGYHKTFGFHSGGVGFRKALMDQVGYYNEDIFLYGAELFVQMQAIGGGFELRYAPGIFMIHKGSGVARSGSGIYFELRNRYWYMRHFASRGDRVRYLPSMILHDFVYCIGRKAIKPFFRAVRDGFRPLPKSLHAPLHRDLPDYRLAVKQTGQGFAIRRTLQRVRKNFR